MFDIWCQHLHETGTAFHEDTFAGELRTIVLKNMENTRRPFHLSPPRPEHGAVESVVRRSFRRSVLSFHPGAAFYRPGWLPASRLDVQPSVASRSPARPSVPSRSA